MIQGFIFSVYNPEGPQSPLYNLIYQTRGKQGENVLSNPLRCNSTATKIKPLPITELLKHSCLLRSLPFLKCFSRYWPLKRNLCSKVPFNKPNSASHWLLQRLFSAAKLRICFTWLEVLKAQGNSPGCWWHNWAAFCYTTNTETKYSPRIWNPWLFPSSFPSSIFAVLSPPNSLSKI